MLGEAPGKSGKDLQWDVEKDLTWEVALLPVSGFCIQKENVI